MPTTKHTSTKSCKMDRNNIQRYEQHLSPFGKKVLHVLVKQCKTRHNRNRNEFQRRQLLSPNRKVLMFNDTHAIKEIDGSADEYEKLLKKTNEPDVPKSMELIETVQIADECSSQNLLYHTYNEIYRDEEPFYCANRRKQSKTNNVDWDNMLDSDLFTNNAILHHDSDLESKIIFSNQNHSEGEKQNKSNTQKRQSQTQISSDMSKKVKECKNMGKAPTLGEDKVGNEFKKCEPKIIMSVPEKKPTKHTIRKQNYTKTVKNWLNDVTTNNAVDEEITNTKDIRNPNDIQNGNEVCVNKPDTKAKKVIQSQLANKGGVMKFSKPKKPSETNKVENKMINKDSKEKNVKIFVAPIKCQVPVKDVVFEVRYVRNNNEEGYKKLLHTKDSEIFVTLIYSNGYNQLNSEHTADTLASDGLIFSCDDLFYYFEGVQPIFTAIYKHIFENNKIICFNGKAILVYLASQFQIDIDSLYIYDAQVGASLVEPDDPPENFAELQRLLSFTPENTVATECALQKAAWYMSLLRDCWNQLSHQLVEDSLWNVFIDIESRLVPILATFNTATQYYNEYTIEVTVPDMELRGIEVDVEKLKTMEEILLAKMKRVEQQCHAAAGRAFQINSAAQVRALIYDELRLDDKANVKIRETIRKGAKSTSEDMLRNLVSAHPLPGLVLSYRQLHKALGTFVVGVAQHVVDGVLRPMWVQTAAATGRIACNNPNLQAIPKTPFSLPVFPEEDSFEDREQLKFRSVYVSGAGRWLVAADFRQVECRVFAHAAADTGLLAALQADADLFRVLAADWLNKPHEEVTTEERERTKRIVYASMYGAGVRKLMDILDVSYERALAVSASFNKRFPGLKQFGRAAVAQCAGGRLRSLGGRVRRLPHVASADPALRSHAERQAINFVIQGSVADLCKTAMIVTTERLRSTSTPAQLVLQLHDELVWAVQDQHLYRAAEIIKSAMEECGHRCGLPLSLPVALSYGANWADMQPLTLSN